AFEDKRNCPGEIEHPLANLQPSQESYYIGGADSGNRKKLRVRLVYMRHVVHQITVELPFFRQALGNCPRRRSDLICSLSQDLLLPGYGRSCSLRVDQPPNIVSGNFQPLPKGQTVNGKVCHGLEIDEQIAGLMEFYD